MYHDNSHFPSAFSVFLIRMSENTDNLVSDYEVEALSRSSSDSHHHSLDSDHVEP